MKEIKQVTSFWIYDDKYAVIDSFYSIHELGSLENVKKVYKELSNNKRYMECFGPFEIVKLTNGTSEFFRLVN